MTHMVCHFHLLLLDEQPNCPPPMHCCHSPVPPDTTTHGFLINSWGSHTDAIIWPYTQTQTHAAWGDPTAGLTSDL